MAGVDGQTGEPRSENSSDGFTEGTTTISTGNVIWQVPVQVFLYWRVEACSIYCHVYKFKNMFGCEAKHGLRGGHAGYGRASLTTLKVVLPFYLGKIACYQP